MLFQQLVNKMCSQPTCQQDLFATTSCDIVVPTACQQVVFAIGLQQANLVNKFSGVTLLF